MMQRVMQMRGKAITIRNLPAAVERAVKDRARRDRLSLNRAVGLLLEEATGGSAGAKGIRHHDFDKYAGRWGKGEADAFEAVLREQRRVDRDDWK
jgi:hypothetical protein